MTNQLDELLSLVNAKDWAGLTRSLRPAPEVLTIWEPPRNKTYPPVTLFQEGSIWVFQGHGVRRKNGTDVVPLKYAARAFWLSEDVGFVFACTALLPPAFTNVQRPLSQHFEEANVKFFRRDADGVAWAFEDEDDVAHALQGLSILNALAS